MIWLILLLSWGCSIFWLSDGNITHSVFDLARILVCNFKRKTIVVKALLSRYISYFFFCILLPYCFLCSCLIWSDKYLSGQRGFNYLHCDFDIGIIDVY